MGEVFQKPVPFGPIQESGSEELAGASPVAMNVVVDKKGCIRRRPGLAAYSEAPSTAVDSDGIAGLHATTTGELYAVGNQAVFKNIYRIAGGAATTLAATNSERLHGAGRPTFAETEMLIVMAAGEEPTKIVRSTGACSRLGGSPPEGTHVIANSSRILLNDVNTQKTWTYYSSVATGNITYAGHEQWNGAGTSGNIVAASRPDPIVAIAENTNEVWLLGSTTVQTYSPDGGLTAAGLAIVLSPATTREFGCAAKYSVVRDDQALAWLDDKRRFVRTDGRTFAILSDPIARTLTDLTTVDDCYGYRVHTGFVDAMVWTFPTEGRTFCYQKGGGWSQWSGWDTATAGWKAFPVLSHALVFGSDTNVVGLTTGRICRLSLGAVTDLGDPLVASVTSGFDDRGTPNRKHCKALRVTMRRGATSSQTTSPEVFIQWRDRLGSWGSPAPLRMGTSGEYDTVVELRSLGVYRTRQWKITFSGSEDLAIAGVTEEYEVLSS